MSSPEPIEISGDERENELEIPEGSDKENEEAEEEEKKKEVKPKRVVRNPRVVLNATTLKGPKGLGCLEKRFEKIKYKGKGHEAEDLRVLLKSYEHWCHRLFPRYPFDECLKKIEHLGHKKEVQTYVKRIRLGLDEFAPTTTPDPEVSENEEDDVREPDVLDGGGRTDATDFIPAVDSEPEELTEDQLERIRVNMERARMLRLERLQGRKDEPAGNHTDGINANAETKEDNVNSNVDSMLVDLTN